MTDDEIREQAIQDIIRDFEDGQPEVVVYERVAEFVAFERYRLEKRESKTDVG